LQISELSLDLRATTQDLDKTNARLTVLQLAEHQARLALAGKPVIHGSSSTSATAIPLYGDQQQLAASHQFRPGQVQGANTHLQLECLPSSTGKQVNDQVDAFDIQKASTSSIPSDGDATDAAEAVEQLAILQTMVHELKVKLALATQVCHGAHLRHVLRSQFVSVFSLLFGL
jgi:hypothetical protein